MITPVLEESGNRPGREFELEDLARYSDRQAKESLERPFSHEEQVTRKEKGSGSSSDFFNAKR